MSSISPTENTEDEQPSRLTERLLIVVNPSGLTVHTHPQSKPLHLGLPELALLSAIDADSGGLTPQFVESRIARVSEEYDVDAARLRRLIKRLRRIRALAPASEASMPRNEPPISTTTSAATPAPLNREDWLLLRCRLVLRLRGGRYEFAGHDGRVRFDLSPTETVALPHLGLPTTGERALEAHRARALERSLDANAFDELLRKLHTGGVLSNTDRREPWLVASFANSQAQQLEEHFQPFALAQDAEEEQRNTQEGRTRVRVVPVVFDSGVPLGVGLVVGYSMRYEEGRLNEHYEFRRDWVWAPDRFDEFTRRPAVYLFSNYLWSHGRNAEMSARVKSASPTSVTIHGGPDTPRYRGDLESYFAANPHVDITVQGEGEGPTAEILDRLIGSWEGDGDVDLSVLSDVPGISFRDGERIVHTGPRERIKELDTIPSPILMGLFDAYDGVGDLLVTIESNRGCPYGCTFCDWGAATMTKIRKFDLQRIFDELKWSSEIGAHSVSLADANFGIFPRDVEIARELARLHDEHGAPHGFGCSYAKNSVKHTKPIIEVLRRAGIVAEGVLSLQTADPATLKAVKRSNIKTEKYDQLANEMREAQLPLVVELMLGLPGSTRESFRKDLQQCIDRELFARINPTTVLINSPMNDPAYREEHGIVTDKEHGPGKMPMLVATASYSREDHRWMMMLRRFFMLAEHFGCLRLVSRFVRQEADIREIDFMDRLMSEVPDLREYPLLGILVTTGWGLMAPPVSWGLVFDELRHYLVHHLGLKNDSALTAVLEAQASMLPAPDRSFPVTCSFAHDVVAWHGAMLEAKASGPEEQWHRNARRLSDFEPGSITIRDPKDVVQGLLGVPIDYASMGAAWEFDSPLARRIVAETV